MTRIADFHAHVYFDADTVEQARALCNEAAERFDVQLGRVHERPVGPHPCWSCQLAFMPEVFGELIPWLSVNRAGLTVFVHPQTGIRLYKKLLFESNRITNDVHRTVETEGKGFVFLMSFECFLS